jgi:hypothetical protein
VASIIPFLPRGAFDDAATKAIGKAFDAACADLYGTCAGKNRTRSCGAASLLPLLKDIAT